MQCAEHTRLFDRFERAAQAYAEAVSGLRDLYGYDLIAQQKLVTHIQEACALGQVALADHEHAHGCTLVAASDASSRSEVRT